MSAMRFARKYTPKTYPPNHWSLVGRIVLAAAALALIGYGIRGLVTGELYMPAKNGGVYLKGVSMVLMVLALLCGAAVLISQIVGHYDKPDKVQTYHRFARNGFFAGCGLAVLAFGVNIVRLLSL
jgi:hypothetical protein